MTVVPIYLTASMAIIREEISLLFGTTLLNILSTYCSIKEIYLTHTYNRNKKIDVMDH